MKQNIQMLLIVLLAGAMFTSCKDEAQTNIVEKIYDEDIVVVIPTNNGHEYVDLGTSVLWAKNNIGADEVTDKGYFFSWGGTVHYATETDARGKGFKWDGAGNSYEFCIGKFDNHMKVSKYNFASSYGTIDNKYTLEKQDDAAAYFWESTWRMPTANEMQELIDSCYIQWIANYNNTGINGYIVYKAKAEEDKGLLCYSGTKTRKPVEKYTLNDDHIFLPLTGQRYMWTFYNGTKNGQYWTSSLAPSNPARATIFSFDADYIELSPSQRDFGHVMRAVCPREGLPAE